MNQKLTFSEDAHAFDSQKYRKAIGSLINADMHKTSLSWIVTKLAQYSYNPVVDRHWIAVKLVFRYLKGTMKHKLCFQKSEDGLTLNGYSDADWGSSGDRKSTSGYCFLLSNNGGAISWKSKEQPTVAL